MPDLVGAPHFLWYRVRFTMLFANAVAAMAALQGSARPAVLSTRASSPSMISVGEKFPACSMDLGFLGSDGEKVDMQERLSGKKTIVVSLPGAFTPT